MVVLVGATSCSNGSQLRPSRDFLLNYRGSKQFSTDERNCLDRFPELRRLIAESKPPEELEGPNLGRPANLAMMTCFGRRFVIAVAEEGKDPTVRGCRKRALLAELEVAVKAGGADLYTFVSSPAVTAAAKKECSSAGKG